MSISTVPASTIPNSDAPNWVVVPAGRCVSSVGESIRVAGLLHRAVTALANLGPLLALAHRTLASAGANTEHITQLRTEQTGVEVWAKELLQSDLHELHTSGVVALWTSLEVAVEDTAVLILLRDATAATLLVQRGVKVPTGIASPPSETDARRLFVRFDRLASGTRRTSEAYCHVLETLGVSVTVDPLVHDKLAELNYVRNCLLHRGGIVDDRVNREAPGLQLACGAAVRLGQDAYLSYFDAVKVFALALMDGAVRSRHIYVRPTVSP